MNTSKRVNTSIINGIEFNELTRDEMKLFFTICKKFKKSFDNTIDISLKEIKEILRIDTENPREIIEIISMKFLNLKFKNYTNEQIEIKNIFNEYSIDLRTNVVRIIIDNNKKYIFINTLDNHSEEELYNYSLLKNNFSKKIFKILLKNPGKSFSITGSELKEMIGIPKSYDNYKIQKRILEVVKKELSNFFKGIEISTNKINKIFFIDITWKENIKKCENSYFLDPKLLNLVTKISNINNCMDLITKSNIKILLKKFSEKEIEVGSKYILKNNLIKIKNVSELKKFITEGVMDSFKDLPNSQIKYISEEFKFKNKYKKG